MVTKHGEGDDHTEKLRVILNFLATLARLIAEVMIKGGRWR